MMSVGLSYGEDGSVKMAESASLVHGNLAVLQGLEEGGLAYGLVSRNVAAITYASSTGAIVSESVGFPGSQEDVSSRTLSGMEWCRLKSSRVVLVLTSYRGFRVILTPKYEAKLLSDFTRFPTGMGRKWPMKTYLRRGEERMSSALQGE
jgi:hypothetical protein